MLDKCCYPSCFVPFRHFGEGRLFRLETDLVPSSLTRTGCATFTEYFWLCGECSTVMILALNTEGEVIIRPLPIEVYLRDRDATFVSVNRERGLVLHSISFRRRRAPEPDVALDPVSTGTQPSEEIQELWCPSEA